MNDIHEYDYLTEDLPYEDFLRLNKKGFLETRIDKIGAANLVASGLVYAPGNLFIFWLGVLVFILSIVGSFTYHWSLFIFGFLFFLITKKISDNIRTNAVWNAICSDGKMYAITRAKKILHVFLKPGADPIMFMAERASPEE